MSKDPKAVLARAQRVSKHGTSDDPTGIDGGKVYIPYEISSRSQERLHIIRLDDTIHYPSYRYLMDVMHTSQNTQAMLVYSFMVVKIRGRNLGDLLEHLAQGDVVFIQKFDTREWPAPAKDKPIIEDIDVVLRQDNDLDFDKKDK